jgi:hypothetical protein
MVLQSLGWVRCLRTKRAQQFLHSKGRVVAHKSFPRWRASIRILVRGGVWRWALAVGFAVALGGGVWFYDVYGTQIRSAWPEWKAEGAPWVRESLLWIEFLASITLTCAFLCWASALLFCLSSVLVFSLLGLLKDVYQGHSRTVRSFQIREAVEAIARHDRLLGTLLNLTSSIGALGLLAVVLKRRLDLWDLGIQLVVSMAMELIVLDLVLIGGRIAWPADKRDG